MICRKVIKLNWGWGGVCHQLQVRGQSPTPCYGRDAEHVLFKISNLLYPTEVRNRYQPDVRGYSLELRQTNLPKKTAIRITQTGAEERWLGVGERLESGVVNGKIKLNDNPLYNPFISVICLFCSMSLNLMS